MDNDVSRKVQQVREHIQRLQDQIHEMERLEHPDPQQRERCERKRHQLQIYREELHSLTRDSKTP